MIFFGGKVRNRREARQTNGVLVYGTGAMYYGEVIVVQLESPAGQPAIRIIHLLESLERRVISHYCEVGAIKEGTESLDRQQHDKTLSFSHTIAPFCLGEGLAEIGDRVINLICVQLG